MKATLDIINQMQADGVIAHYALGGGVAASYYTEPATILEIEVFVILPFNPNGPQAAIAALRAYLVSHGCEPDGEYFEISSWPVQFLVANSDGEREAVASSLPVPVDDERTWVMMAEHLIALMVSANPPEDRIWMLRLIEADAVDELTLKAIMKTHGLTAQWERFEKQFPPQFPSNDKTRKRLTLLSFSEKIKMLEKLRDRDKVIAAAGLRRRRHKPPA